MGILRDCLIFIMGIHGAQQIIGVSLNGKVDTAPGHHFISKAVFSGVEIFIAKTFIFMMDIPILTRWYLCTGKVPDNLRDEGFRQWFVTFSVPNNY